MRSINPGILLAIAVTFSACSSTEHALTGGTETTGSSPSMTSRFAQLFGSSPSPAPAPASQSGTPTGDEQIDCPPMDIRQGASTLAINSASKDATTMGLRYQGTFGQLARECAIVGANLNIKVGVQGRIILGPAGTPGQMEVPVRFALVKEGPDPKTLWTKLYKIPVVVPEGQTAVSFTNVEENLSVPKPSGADLDAYVIYVGFDAMAMSAVPKKKTPPARKR